MVSEKRLHENRKVQEINKLLVRWKRPLSMQWESWMKMRKHTQEVGDETFTLSDKEKLEVG